MSRRRTLSTVIALVLSLLAWTSLAFAQAPFPIIIRPDRLDLSPVLKDIPPTPPAFLPVSREIRIFPLPRKQPPRALDPVLQGSPALVEAPAVAGSFDGISNVNSVLPPDTNGDVGPNHYVQIVNISFAIYDKAGNLLYGPADNNTLWAGFGGECELQNDGDPIVLYDHLADRWLISQFAFASLSGPFYQCIAVSQTGDPTGAYHRYAFLISNTKINDYPKFGVWPDAYYMAVNQFSCTFGGAICSGAGQGVVAFQREQMLQGLSAQMVYFDLPNVPPGYLPSDLDGPAPPTGAPNYFMRIEDDPDSLEIREFRVNWANPASSTFTGPTALPTAAFDGNMCGASRDCIPQPGTTERVDAIADRLMYRLQYRNFGTHQTLVVNHTVDTNGTDHAGIRWYELRSTGGGWSMHQQGTYAPDTDHRWMASAAMDGAGNIALGFSVSSSGTFPSIRYTGRLDGDPLGLMTQGEGTLMAGGGSQTHTASRWGDYSMLAVDPTDDCTFWYTQQYYATTSMADWRTRIGSFKLPSCGGGVTNTPPTADNKNVTISEDTATTVNLTATDPDAGDCELSMAVVNSPSKGTLGPVSGSACTAGSPNQDQATVVYTPNPNATGSDSFTYRANDGSADSNTATVSITINSTNDTPVGNNQSVATPQNTAVNITLTASDVDTCELPAFSIVTGPANGTVSVPANNACVAGSPNTDSASVTYTPNTGFSGSDSFTFKVNDGALDSDIATVSVTVSPPAANANNMYVWDIKFKTRTSLGTHDERIVVTVRRDSDADGVAESADAVVAGASVTVTLTGPVNRTFTGTTNSVGVYRTPWQSNLPNGTYTAEVTSLGHGTYTWNKNLDPTSKDTDLDTDNLPDQRHTIPH